VNHRSRQEPVRLESTRIQTGRNKAAKKYHKEFAVLNFPQLAKKKCNNKFKGLPF